MKIAETNGAQNGSQCIIVQKHSPTTEQRNTKSESPRQEKSEVRHEKGLEAKEQQIK